MPRLVIRSDTQLFGSSIILGGVDTGTQFGSTDLGPASVLLRKNGAGTLSPLFTIQAVNPTDMVIVIGGSASIAGDLSVTTINGTNVVLSGLKQYATYATEPGFSVGPGFPGWSTGANGATGAILRLRPGDDFGAANGLGDGVDPATIGLGNQGSVNSFIPIEVFRDGLLLRAGSAQEYTVAAVSGLIEVTFVGQMFTDARVAVVFRKNA